MYSVVLKIDGGKFFMNIRCEALLKDENVPGNLLMVKITDPVPTEWGPMKLDYWSVNPIDIANYMCGEILQEGKGRAPELTGESEEQKTQEILTQEPENPETEEPTEEVPASLGETNASV